MRAAAIKAYGPFDAIEVVEMPDPVAGPGEVVIDVEASDVNFPDLLYIEGKYQSKPPMPFSPGLGATGRVAALGPQVSGLSVGDRVLVLPEYGCHAEKLKAPADWCFPVPAEMPATVAAALGLVYQTAWFALKDRARIAAGDSVVVLGASGGIGMATVQLAKALGAGTVIAATRGSEGAALARQLGADHVVDTAGGEPADMLRDGVRAATSGKGAGIVVDPVGGVLGEVAVRTLGWCGRLVVVGFASGAIPTYKANYLLVKNISISGLQWTDYRARRLDEVRDAQAQIFELWSQGLLRPNISKILPLERIVEALTDVSQGRARGKIILTTSDQRTDKKA